MRPLLVVDLAWFPRANYRSMCPITDRVYLDSPASVARESSQSTKLAGYGRARERKENRVTLEYQNCTNVNRGYARDNLVYYIHLATNCCHRNKEVFRVPAKESVHFLFPSSIQVILPTQFDARRKPALLRVITGEGRTPVTPLLY